MYACVYVRTCIYSMAKMPVPCHDGGERRGGGGFSQHVSGNIRIHEVQTKGIHKILPAPISRTNPTVAKSFPRKASINLFELPPRVLKGGGGEKKRVGGMSSDDSGDSDSIFRRGTNLWM